MIYTRMVIGVEFSRFGQGEKYDGKHGCEIVKSDSAFTKI